MWSIKYKFEVIVLDDDGNLTCTYTDTSASDTLLTQDATALGCSSGWWKSYNGKQWLLLL